MEIRHPRLPANSHNASLYYHGYFIYETFVIRLKINSFDIQRNENSVLFSKMPATDSLLCCSGVSLSAARAHPQFMTAARHNTRESLPGTTRMLLSIAAA